jgi:predicted N-acetyltransferase YhbS
MDTSRAAAKGIVLRPVAADDAATLGRICYEAFKTVAEAHSFPPDFPSAEAGAGLMEMMIAHPAVYGVVAEDGGGKVIGSNFLWEQDSVSGVGPITIDPASQNSTAGRRLMEDVIRRSDEQGHPAIRLVQAAYHNRSLALYTKLGFDTVEPLSMIAGPRVTAAVEGRRVRQMTTDDLAAASELCFRVHGHGRANETAAAIEGGTAAVVEYDGRITGYTTGIGFFGHSVGTSNDDIKELIAAAEEFTGPGFLLPTRNADLLRWCLENGLRIVQPMTLMSRGIYREPQGAFLPSILF